MFFFFGIVSRKQLKLAVWRVDTAMQQSGSLNQLLQRFVADTLTLDVR